MNKIKAIILLLFVFSAVISKAQYTSTTGGGEWSENSTWSGGVAPPYTNVANDVTINDYVTSDQSIVFDPNGNTKDKFTINDTLIIYGDLSLGLDDDFTLGANAVLIIFGNFTAVNKVTIENGGYFVVLGNFAMTGGAQTSYDNTGDGQTFITGDVDTDVGGGGVPELECDPDLDTGCGYGDASDLAEDPIWDLIDEVDDGVSCSLSATGTVTDESDVSAGDGAIDLTITSTGNPDVEWYKDGVFYSSFPDITDLDNDGDLSGLSSGNYSVYISESYCSVSLSFTVSVSCTNPSLSTVTTPTICNGSSYDLSNIVVVDANGTSPTYTYHSGTPALPGNELASTTVSPTTTTTYYILGTNGSCTDELAVDVTVNPLPVATIAFTAGNGVICDGDDTQLEVTVTTGASPFDITVGNNRNAFTSSVVGTTSPWTFEPGTLDPGEEPVWIPADGASSIYTYTITTITDDNGCTATNVDNVDVDVYKIPETGPQYHISNDYGN